MTEHIITYDFDNNSFSNLPNDSSGEKKFIFTADDVVRDEGGTAVTIVAKYKKIKAKRPIIISWKSSKPIAIHIDISREDYDELTDIDENLVYFAYGDNEKTIEDYKDYKGESLKDIFDRVKIVEDKVEEILPIINKRRDVYLCDSDIGVLIRTTSGNDDSDLITINEGEVDYATKIDMNASQKAIIFGVESLSPLLYKDTKGIKEVVIPDSITEIL